MKMYNIEFGSVDQIIKFVNEAKNYSGNIELKSGIYYVDGKSLLGVINIGTQKKICLLISGEAEQSFISKVQFAVA